MAKPRIGIPVSHRVIDELHQLTVSGDLVRAIHQSGGISVIIPKGLEEDLHGLLGSVQGFVLPGGLDIDPKYYGQEPSNQCGQINPTDDGLHLAVATYALRKDIPVLGICRGMQMLNVAAKGTLYQDISTWTTVQHRQQAPRWYATHGVKTEEGSLVREMFGQGDFRVNSFHHQAVEVLGENLICTARSTDGVIEAIESIKHRYVVGLQWHPELLLEHHKKAQVPFVKLIEAAYKSQGR